MNAVDPRAFARQCFALSPRLATAVEGIVAEMMAPVLPSDWMAKKMEDRRVRYLAFAATHGCLEEFAAGEGVVPRTIREWARERKLPIVPDRKRRAALRRRHACAELQHLGDSARLASAKVGTSKTLGRLVRPRDLPKRPPTHDLRMRYRADLLRAYALRWCDEDIAALWGIKPKSVRMQAHRLGLPAVPTRGHRMRMRRRAAALELVALGCTKMEAARLCGIDRQGLSRKPRRKAADAAILSGGAG